MANVFMEKVARENGLLTNGKFLYGIKNGYHISSQYQSAGYVQMFGLRFSLINLTESDKEEIKQFVRQNKKELKLASAEFKANVVIINLKEFPTCKDVLANALHGIITFFTENAFVSGCSLSQSAEDIKFVKYKGQIMAVSQQVIEDLQKNDRNSNEDNENKSYIPGVVGASIGGIIGMIPWIVISMLGYISSISGLAMGWLVKTGYEKANGKKGGAQMMILILAIIIFTYLGMMISQALFVIKDLTEQGYMAADIRIWELIKWVIVLPFTAEGIGYGIWGELLFGYFFTAIGSVPFLKRAHASSEFSAGSQMNLNLQQPIEGFSI